VEVVVASSDTPEHLDDVIDSYGGGVDRDVIRGWWSLRSLTTIRWLVQHGFDPILPGCEIDVLRRGFDRGGAG
jgi:hypothetical protein